MFRDATLVIIPPPIKKKKKKGSDFSRSQYMVTFRGKKTCDHDRTPGGLPT